jgi:adenylate kinase
VPGRCDQCGGELRQRPDDRAEAVERRLLVFEEATAPLIDYYQSRDLVRTIDGNQPPSKVTRLLQDALSEVPAPREKLI